MAEPHGSVDSDGTRQSEQLGSVKRVFDLERVATGVGRLARNLTNSKIAVQVEDAPQDTEFQRTKALEATKEKFRYFSERSADEVVRELQSDAKQVRAKRSSLSSRCSVHDIVLMPCNACIHVQGLSQAEARQRLLMHGPNELAKDPPRPFWKLLLAQFSDMLVMMLIVAAIISGALGQIAAAGNGEHPTHASPLCFSDLDLSICFGWRACHLTVAIITIVFLNAVLGVVQVRASRSLCHTVSGLRFTSLHVTSVHHDRKVVQKPLSTHSSLCRRPPPQ